MGFTKELSDKESARFAKDLAEARRTGACIATRWKDALVTHDGPPPSIVRAHASLSLSRCAPGSARPLLVLRRERARTQC